jgi:hypothetical protein
MTEADGSPAGVDRRARLKAGFAAKMRGEEVWQPEPEPDYFPSSDGQKYAMLFYLAAVVGVGVLFACQHWHTVWQERFTSGDISAIARRGAEPLAAQYPWLAGIVAGFITLILGRVYIFMRRLESK